MTRLGEETVARDLNRLVEMLEMAQEYVIQQGNATLTQDIETVFELATERRLLSSEMKVEALS